jgi:serine/threonine protein kinase/Tol biopolymer transport system component
MTSDKRSRVEEVLSAALDRHPNERVAFLERACGGDAELRREVESLLGWAVNDGLMSTAQVAALVEDTEHALNAGERLGNYEVLRRIGAGGMGEVYLARDTRLGRQVALKLLPAAAVLHYDRVRRFMQEAQVVSALNHPNILTIHEVAQSGTMHYIVTEYVEGETLRERLQRSPFRLREVLEVAVQLADALAAAHRTGIIHRDVKPENIMIRRDRIVKLLDFGLAKLMEDLAELGSADAEAPTRQAIRTNPGMVMGTAAYMSPEQARGLAVDVRTDVWSLGCVLYEMVAGRRPFEGATHGDTIVLILEREPVPLVRHVPEVPPELERIVQKALTKDAEERYQTIKDMAIDLRRLKNRLEAEAELERSAPAEGRDRVTSIGQGLAASTPEAGVPPTAPIGAASTSSLEYAVTEIRRHKVGVALVGVILIGALVGGGYSVYRLLGGRVRSPTLREMKITELTADGTATVAALSRDGKYVAYVLREQGRETLRIRQVSTASDLQLVLPSEVFHVGLTFSPEGDYLCYVTLPVRRGPVYLPDLSGTLYRVPVLGGVSRRLLTGVDSPITFSPDGSRFAFVRVDRSSGASALVVANADGGEEHRLSIRRPPDVYVTDIRLSPGWAGSGPAWSPDGKVIACGVGRFARQQVVEVSALDGSEKPIGSQSWQFVGRLAWLPDGSGLVMTATEQSLSSQLWQLSYPAGEARRITNDLNSYADLGLDAGADSLVTVQSVGTQHLWVVTPSEDPTRAKKVVSTTLSGRSTGGPLVSWTPDGRLVYAAKSGDRSNLWVVNRDGTEPKQLTAFTNSINTRPSVSPDGRYIAFVSDRSGARNIWRVDIDGSNLVQLTTGELDTYPTCSPDSRWVVYASRASGKHSIRKVPIEGGEAVLLQGTELIPMPTVSPDGKLILYVDRDEGVDSPDRILLIPFDGGKPVKIFDLPPTCENDVMRWTPDGRALTYVDTRDDAANIWSQPLKGGTPRQITDFKSDSIGVFDWSRDGKQLALWRGTQNQNVVLIRDFK